MRKRSRPEGSLDLLLDTICNMFGGIVFIALLVMLMLQDQSSRLETASVSDEDIQRLVLEEQLAQSEVKRRRSLLDSQLDVVAQLAPPEFLVERDNLIQTTQQVESINNQYEETRSANLSIVDQMRRSVEEYQALPAEIERLTEKLRQLRRELEIEEEKITVRLPRVHTSHETEYGLIVRYGRLYVWHLYDANGIRQGLNTDEFIVVEEKFDSVITQPRPNAGVGLRSDEASKVAIRSRISRIAPRVKVVTIGLHTDSFHQFAALRDVLLTMGIRYRLLLLAEGEGIADRGGTGGSVQ